tara:strand:- start:204 stop:395 length:192 start_codon:yes stop_codon:yes gene_type:complete
MIKFIKLHIIADDTIVVDYINVNHILKVYMSDKNVHVELINKEILKLKDENLDVFMDHFHFTE